MATRAHRRRSPTPMPPPAGRPRQIERPRLRRQRHGRRRRLRGQRPIELRLPHRRLDHGKQRHLRGDPDFDVYATGGLNAFVCTTTFLGFDQFSFWNSCMGSHADSQVVPDAKLAAGGSPLPGSPAIGSGKDPTSKCAGQPTPGPRRPGLQQRRHDPPRHRALEHRRELAPPVGGPRVRRAHDHDQRARAAAEHRRQERADAEERGQLRPRQHRRRQWHPEHQISGRSHDERKVARRTRRTRAPACMPSFGAASRSFAFPPGRVVPMRFATASAHGGAEQQRKDARRERSLGAPASRSASCASGVRLSPTPSTLARDRLRGRPWWRPDPGAFFTGRVFATGHDGASTGRAPHATSVP